MGTITFSLTGTGGSPIEGAVVEAFLPDGITFKGRTVTDDAGEAELDLPDGTYEIDVSGAGVLSVSTTVTVASTANVELEATEVSIVTPNPPAKCKVYGFVTGPDGRFLEARVVVRSYGVGLGTGSVVSNGSGTDAHNLGVAESLLELSSDSSTGLWQVDLVQDTLVQVSIPILGLVKNLRVPKVDSVNIADTMGDPGFAEYGMTVDRGQVRGG